MMLIGSIIKSYLSWPDPVLSETEQWN